LELPSVGPRYDPRSVRGLFNTAWTDTHTLMSKLEANVGRDTAEGLEIEDLARQWSTALGRPVSPHDVVDCTQSNYEWRSPGGALLEQLWHASHEIPAAASCDNNVRLLDVVEKNHPDLVDSHVDGLRRLLRECNYRGQVNQRLASHLQLPYVPNTARLPFRSRFYDRPGRVSDQLPSVLALDAVYAVRAAQAEALRGERLVLPVFLALALRDADTRHDLWGAIGDLRARAQAFRERRAALDHALEAEDLDAVRDVARAVRTEAAQLTQLLGAAAGAALEDAYTSFNANPTAYVAGTPLDWALRGVSALIAGARKLIPASVAQRLTWRLCRPELRFLSDIGSESRSITNALPAVQRLWGLADSRMDDFVRRYKGFAALQTA